MSEPARGLRGNHGLTWESKRDAPQRQQLSAETLRQELPVSWASTTPATAAETGAGSTPASPTWMRLLGLRGNPNPATAGRRECDERLAGLRGTPLTEGVETCMNPGHRSD